MPKVSREVVGEGDYHEVAAAVRLDGSSPFLETLEALGRGVWLDPDAGDFPDAGQPSMRRRVLAEIAHLAQEGEPARDYDYLVDGIWEFKIGTLRVTFYDTDGQGRFDPKEGERPDSYWTKRRWDFPEGGMDEYVRLGHCFAKTGQKTRDADIELALKVREEDLSHDRD